ncbi:MAG: tetratricopeptide repeat protein [Candidatus Coatesbacteria bacterium]|nr:MAG: tetratricopeptide repeat protein [Candidatus Coatesbacteria bacterium]
MIYRRYGAATVAAAICIFIIVGCKPKEVVITREDTLAKEDAVIEDLQGKIAERQEEIEQLEGERLSKTEKLATDERQKRDAAIRKYEEFLGKYPISPYTPDVLIALGELYLERSEEDHVLALDDYQLRLESAGEAGEIFYEPEPQPHYEKTIAAYQQIALKYKDFPYADVAYYGLGYCLKAQGEEEESARTLYKLTQQYPESKFVPEAYFRIGEYFFDQYEFDKAVKYYALVSSENPNFYDKALYKMGWAFYNQGDIGVSSLEYQKAIDSFTQLIESSDKRSVLTEEAMEFTAISLTEWSSDPNDETAVAKALGHYSDEFRGEKVRDYSPGVLHKLGDVYLYKQDKLKAAATAYETVLEYYPDYDKAPELLDSLVECYLREEDYDNAHNTRVRIVDRYGPGSEWYENQDSLDVRHKALQRWENSLYEVAVYFNVHADRKTKTHPEESKELYGEAINRFNQYLASFPTNEKAYHVNFYLAQAYDNIGDLPNAGDQYQKTALGYTDLERYKVDHWAEKGITQENALFNAIVAYSDIFDKDREGEEKGKAEPSPSEAAGAEPATNGLQTYGPIAMPVKQLTLNEANLVRACNAFVDRYPQSQEIPSVLSKVGEVYFFVDDYERAREAYEKLVNNYPQPLGEANPKEHDQLYVNAVESIAKSYFNEAEFYEKAGSYEGAEAKYALARQWYAKTEREAKERNVHENLDRAKSLAGLTGLKAAEMKGAGIEIEEIEAPEIEAELLEEAEYEDFVVLYPPLPPIEAAAFAAKQAEAQAYESNAADHQGTDVGRLSLGKAADTYYKIRDWDNAARVYLEYVKAYPQAEDVKTGYEKAAECYERQENWDDAANVYLAIADHPQYKNTGLGRDSLFRAGLMYEQQQDWTRTANTFARFAEEYPEEAKPLLEATFRQARAEERLGRNEDALENHKKVAGVYKYAAIEGFEMGGTEKYAAESMFKITDIKYDDYESIEFVMPQKVMEANLQKKVKQSQDLIAGYTECADMGVGKWSVAAHCRMADVYLDFRDALRNAEIPEELRPEYWETLPDDDQRKFLLEDAYYTYTSELEEQALPLEDKAITEYGEAVSIAEAAGITSPWSRKAYNQLLAIVPYEVVKYEDVGNQGFTSDSSWLTSNTLEEGWLEVAYDDAVWTPAGASYWREKDLEKVVANVPGEPQTIWGGSLDENVYFRKKFSFTYDPGNYEAVIQTRGAYKLYVNGTLVGQTDAYAEDPWVKPDTYDLSGALHLGDNVVCVEILRARDDSYGLRFALVPEGGFPVPEPAFEETAVPGEEFGGIAPEEGEMPMEEWPPPVEEGGELLPVPGEEAEFGPSEGEGFEEFGEPTPLEEETPPMEEGETVTPTEEPTTEPAAGGEAETLPEPGAGEETLPEPGAGEESGYEAEAGGDIDFESVGTPEEFGDTGAEPEEEPLGEEF